MPEQARAADLPPFGRDLHFHTHLDIFVHGKKVPVPAGIGLGPPDSSLHTHSTSGILHVESSTTKADFTLGQLFIEWNVRLSEKCVGAYCRPATDIAIYVDAKRTSTPPPRVRLAPYRQIALVIGKPPSAIPSGYDCSDAADVERASCQGFLKRPGSGSAAHP